MFYSIDMSANNTTRSMPGGLAVWGKCPMDRIMRSAQWRRLILTRTTTVLALTVVGLAGDDEPKLHLGNQIAATYMVLLPPT